MNNETPKNLSSNEDYGYAYNWNTVYYRCSKSDDFFSARNL